ncbi:A disintegrin and metalloproteinase with thrombospondin motifs 10 isoform X2 [Tachysurus ichikawai]
METVWRSLACVGVIAMVTAGVGAIVSSQDGQAAFLSSLTHYEIAIPIRVGPCGESTYDAEASNRHRRHRRSPEMKQKAPEPQLYYQLSTPSTSLFLNLTLQSGLLSRKFRIEYWGKGRLEWSHPYSSGCQYMGHLQHQPQSSTVALSNCNGLGNSALIELASFIEALFADSRLQIFLDILPSIIVLPSQLGVLDPNDGFGFEQHAVACSLPIRASNSPA